MADNVGRFLKRPSYEALDRSYRDALKLIAWQRQRMLAYERHILAQNARGRQTEQEGLAVIGVTRREQKAQSLGRELVEMTAEIDEAKEL
ncbi:MAG TPA: hypothetical protein VFN76_09765 [Candidatus Limnocylindria bacterium]|nr:hypothetical protein [Candidatus Limnocylindria bacterium]